MYLLNKTKVTHYTFKKLCIDGHFIKVCVYIYIYIYNKLTQNCFLKKKKKKRNKNKNQPKLMRK